MVESVTRSLGPPTILVNAAGILRPTRFLDIPETEWDAVVDVSLKGSFLCSKACLPAMVDQRWGRIVNFSSTAGKNVSTLGGAHYTAAKAGVLGLTRALAAEVAEYGICVNAVCPGLIDTEMTYAYCSPEQLAEYVAATPIRRLGSPDEVAELVAFLCSERAAYITGAALDINGGQLMV
jgi:NAD(P)-dependent dehydrogenase (short-subunit alcohol dehydrogenase family)